MFYHKKIFRSFLKKILPIIFNIFQFFSVNRRVINFLNDKSFEANNKYNFDQSIKDLLRNSKILALDIGAYGGFNSDNYFPSRYEKFFEPIMVEPQRDEAEKLKKKYTYVIDKGLWSSTTNKKLFFLKNRPGSSSMYKPNKKFFSAYRIDQKNYKNFEITDEFEIKCETIEKSLREISIDKLDYLKIDTQGSELEILKGLGDYKPLMVRTEVQILSMYEDVPNWSKLLGSLYEKNYVICDWKGIGPHVTRTPVECEMLFVPNFRNDEGKKLIIENKEKFISLMLIFGQIDLLKNIIKDIKLDAPEFIEKIQDRYFN